MGLCAGRHRGHSTQSNGWDSGALGTHCRQGKLENRRTSQKGRPEVSSVLKVWDMGTRPYSKAKLITEYLFTVTVGKRNGMRAANEDQDTIIN